MTGILSSRLGTGMRTYQTKHLNERIQWSCLLLLQQISHRLTFLLFAYMSRIKAPHAVVVATSLSVPPPCALHNVKAVNLSISLAAIPNFHAPLH